LNRIEGTLYKIIESVVIIQNETTFTSVKQQNIESFEIDGMITSKTHTKTGQSSLKVSFTGTGS